MVIIHFLHPTAGALAHLPFFKLWVPPRENNGWCFVSVRVRTVSHLLVSACQMWKSAQWNMAPRSRLHFGFKSHS